jgi:hypothetical protein
MPAIFDLVDGAGEKIHQLVEVQCCRATHSSDKTGLTNFSSVARFAKDNATSNWSKIWVLRRRAAACPFICTFDKLLSQTVDHL